jgi:PAS domain S-box-containing protein
MTFHEEFLDQLPLGAYRTLPDGRIEYANAALAELLGYPSVGTLKQASSRYFYVDLEDREKWRDQIESAVSGKLVCFKTRWRRLDGRIIRVKNSGRAVRENGTVVAYEGVVADITEQPAPLEPIKTPVGLRSGHLWPDAVLEELPICILRKDTRRRIIWANHTFCRIEGLKRDELLTHKNSDALLYGAEFDELHRISDERVMKTGQPHTTTERHRSGDGTMRMVQVVKVPFFEDSGSVAGVEVFFWDAANPLQPMAELERAKQRAERFERLLRSRYSVVYEHDLHGYFLGVNEAAAELTGRPREKWHGLHFSKVIAPEYRAFAKAQIERKLNSPNPSEEVTSYELEILAEDGRRIPVEITSRLLMQQGQPVGVIGYVWDLSRRREVEHRRLREIHHRVKNNLHTIYTLLGSERRRAENEQTRDVLLACQARVLTMAELHQQLYRADQIDVGKYVQELTVSLISTYQRAWQRITPRVTVDSAIHLSSEALTPCALVLHELISNAMKHAFPPKTKADGERHGTIFVNLKTRDDGVFRLQVTDTGVGLPAHFNPRKTRSLGMSLIHGLIEKQLKGGVEFDTSSSGTSFSVSFLDPMPIMGEINVI